MIDKPEKPAKQDELIEVLLLKGYVPEEPTVVSFGGMVIKQKSPGELEYQQIPATLEKHLKGTIQILSAAEARKLIRAGAAVRPGEATDAQLVAAGLKKPAPPKADDGDE